MLALALRRTVRELDATLGEDELIGWLAYNQLAPIDASMRQEMSNGIGFASLLGGWGISVKPADLMPQWERKELPQKVLREAYIAHMRALKEKLPL